MTTQKGFTLLELMIVVIVVGILVSLAIPMFQGATIKAKLAEMVVNVHAIEQALELCTTEYGWDGFFALPSAKRGASMRSYGGAIYESDKFRYSHNYDITNKRLVIQIRIKKETIGTEFNESLCLRIIERDTKKWSGSFSAYLPWRKYLKQYVDCVD